MQFCIFNNIENTIPVELEVAFINTSLVLAAKTNLFTNASEFITLFSAPDFYTPEQKLKAYPGIVKMFDKDANIEETEELMKSYVYLKNLKRKTKQQLISYQFAIRAVKATEDFIKASVNLNLVVYNFDMLKEFIAEGKYSIFKNFNGATNFAEPIHVRRFVDFFTSALLSINFVPVLPDISAIKNINIINVNENISLSNNSNIDVIEFPIFKIHSPLTFGAGQIKQIRSELNEKISAFYTNFANFSKDNCNIIFDNNSLQPIIDFCKNNSQLLEDINYTLNQNIFLKQVPVNKPELCDYIVFINFTNISNLLKIYNLYPIYPDDIITHVEKFLIKYTDLNFLTYFLTIKENKND